MDTYSDMGFSAPRTKSKHRTSTRATLKSRTRLGTRTRMSANPWFTFWSSSVRLGLVQISVLTCVEDKCTILASKTYRLVVLQQFLQLHSDPSTYCQIFCFHLLHLPVIKRKSFSPKFKFRRKCPAEIIKLFFCSKSRVKFFQYVPPSGKSSES